MLLVTMGLDIDDSSYISILGFISTLLLISIIYRLPAIDSKLIDTLQLFEIGIYGSARESIKHNGNKYGHTKVSDNLVYFLEESLRLTSPLNEKLCSPDLVLKNSSGGNNIPSISTPLCCVKKEVSFDNFIPIFSVSMEQAFNNINVIKNANLDLISILCA